MLTKKSKVIGVVFAAGLAFSTGVSAKAENGWINNLLFDNSVKLHDVGKQKVKEIKENGGKGMEEILGEKVDAIFEEKQKSVAQELDEYYMQAVETLAGEQFGEVELKIEEIETAVLNKYKAEIDAILAQ